MGSPQHSAPFYLRVHGSVSRGSRRLFAVHCRPTRRPVRPQCTGDTAAAERYSSLATKWPGFRVPLGAGRVGAAVPHVVVLGRQVDLQMDRRTRVGECRTTALNGCIPSAHCSQSPVNAVPTHLRTFAALLQCALTAAYLRCFTAPSSAADGAVDEPSRARDDQ